jgi:ATP-dependent helicase/nuclease subunit A
MPADNIKWTDPQQRAIDARGSDILVSASAGTGKTAVLSQRCLTILTDPKSPADLTSLLVITFTDAAAEQMKAQIAQKIQDRIAGSSTPHLRRQNLLLPAADICTIHAFCKRVITQNFHLLDIDPTFRIMDPDQQTLLKLEILESTVQNAWADPALVPALNKLFYRKNLKTLSDSIIRISEFLDCVISRNDWYQRAMHLADITAAQVSQLRSAQKNIILDKLDQCRQQLEYTVLLDQKLAAGAYLAEQIHDQLLPPVIKCVELMKKDRLTDCADLIRNSMLKKFRGRPKEMPKKNADLIKAPAASAKKIFKSLTTLALINPDYENIVAPLAPLQTKVLLQLVQRFDRRYTEQKRLLNCLDFADLEHLMFKLLDENETVAESLRKKFEYIFVDEFQDINKVQAGIIKKISRDNNVFVVGDVKQSIYGFRQASPEIFLQQLNNAADTSATGQKSLRVDLTDNFRSRKDILDFANTVFGRIMKPSLASIDYDQNTFLKPGLASSIPEPSTVPTVQIYLLDEEPSTDDSDNNNQPDEQPGIDSSVLSAAQRQAAFIARQIKQIVGAENGRPEFDIFDKKTNTTRPVTYRDIVILMRSLAQTAKEYVEMLRLSGIPVSSQTSAGYFASTEINDSIALLKVLDNPQRDIELAAVLRSQFFNLTDTELLMIRKHTDSERQKNPAPFYDCLINYTKNGPDKNLRQKLNFVIEKINTWRAEARTSSLADLLWKIYRSTGYLSFVLAQPAGDQRYANLLKMHDRAIQFEGFAQISRSTSLARFVDFLEKLLEQGQDWAPAEPDSSAENAVRILSVHKSKGLEFPVVFLAELNKKFNMSDSFGDCLFDDDNTIGLQLVHPDSKIKLPTLAHQVIAEKKKQNTLAEEMRILYVALTRAREKLIITASKKQQYCRNILTQSLPLAKQPPADFQLKSARSHLDWLLYALADQKKLRTLFELDSSDSSDSDSFSIELISRENLKDISLILFKNSQHDSAAPETGADSLSTKQLDEIVSNITASLSWQYPFADMTTLPAKTSVSRLTHLDDQFASLDLSDALNRLPKIILAERSAETEVQAKIIGTAVHLIIQNIDLKKQITIDSIQSIAQHLCDQNLIPTNALQQIDFDPILKFFQSDLGKLALDPENTVLREWPFTLAVDAAELNAISAPDIVIVQGIIDMIIQTPSGLIVIDFKTDSVKDKDLHEYAKRYHTQLRFYAKAAQSILAKPLKDLCLYLLTPARTIKLDL